jgi:hypothetical protein
MRLTIKALEGLSFCEPCETILVNPQGCAVRCSRPVEVQTRVRLEGLPTEKEITASVVNCVFLGQYERFWLLGLALDEPANVWGIENPPDDWSLISPEASLRRSQLQDKN